MHIDDLVQVAEDRGYLTVDDDRITYHCAKNSEWSYTNPEEKVRAFVYSWLIIEKEYPTDNIAIEVAVPRRTPEDRADIVVYEEQELETPYLVVETKKREISNPDWNQAVEQGFGNANGLRVTRYLLVDCFKNSKFFQVQDFPPDERSNNHIGSRERLPEAFNEEPEFRLVAGGENDISPSSVENLEGKVRRAHAAIWSGGKRDPLVSFEEWAKLLFAKIYDENYTPNGDARRFQVGIGEKGSQVANRVHDLFLKASEEDPGVFGDEKIDLPAEKITTVVKILEEEAFVSHDLDRIGRAFEQFFGQIFRGQLGQYFTRRELTRYIVSTLSPRSDEFILDPTVGSGGFLLEALFQGWDYIEENFNPNLQERHKVEFAQRHLYGIEIHETLARICKTNLILHKDGHTNVQGDKSCLDVEFDLDRGLGDFDLVVGNPPFGDSIEEGDTDRLGDNSLANFDLSRGKSLKAEIAIIEQAIDFLKPGGRLGFVIPDGILNNSSERSNCPQTRRYLLREGKILGVTSLPDHTFDQAGAQNKTSILFFKKYTEEEKTEFRQGLLDVLDSNEVEWDDLTGSQKWEMMTEAVQEVYDYPVFLAEAWQIGYAPTGKTIDVNDLYSVNDNSMPNEDDLSTILGQYRRFQENPEDFTPTDEPETMSIQASDMIGCRDDGRMDPKYHLFQREAMEEPPEGMTRLRLGDVIDERNERVEPTEHPETEFLVPTVTHDGHMEPREAGKGHNPVSWEGQYFSGGSRWSYMYEGDIIFSKIDLWKGAISVVGPDFDGAISTSEFPIYRVTDTDQLNAKYLKLLLRSKYFQKAIRAITTGHSNRRRTQKSDFEDLVVFVPTIERQRAIAEEFEERRERISEARSELDELQDLLDDAVTGEVHLDEIIEEETASDAEKVVEMESA
jgi:type I restriction enzyme M protein